MVRNVHTRDIMAVEPTVDKQKPVKDGPAQYKRRPKQTVLKRRAGVQTTTERKEEDQKILG